MNYVMLVTIAHPDSQMKLRVCSMRVQGAWEKCMTAEKEENSKNSRVRVLANAHSSESERPASVAPLLRGITGPQNMLRFMLALLAPYPAIKIIIIFFFFFFSLLLFFDLII